MRITTKDCDNVANPDRGTSACDYLYSRTHYMLRRGYGRDSFLTFSVVQVERQHLEVVIGGEVLEEVALSLHDAVELITVDLAGAITVSLCDHVLHLLVIDVLSELLSHAGEVAEGDPGGVVVVEELEDLLDVL